MLAFATKPSLRSTIAVVAVIMLSVLLTLSGAVPVTAAPTRPDPQPNALVRRQIPMPITASAGPRRWCCRERGRCVTTNCQPRVANGRRSFGARGFPTQNECIETMCSSQCVRSTRDQCSFYFFKR